ncbi:MAG TPA: hypothetical protein VI462_09990, partial [Acidimicrobiia bacterium]
AALGGATALARGGGVLVDVSLAGTAAWLARPAVAPARQHRITEVGPDRWVVAHGARATEVAAPRAAPAAASAECAGGSTERVLAELGGGGPRD